MAIQSSISELSLIDLFQILSFQGKTGRLVITDGPDGKNAQVLFCDGAVGFASIYQLVPKTALPLLFEWGVIDKDTVQQVENTLCDHASLSECLEKGQVIGREYLNRIVADHTKNTVYEMFKWHTGGCRFTEVGSYDEKLDIIVPLNTENLILEGARRIDEWAKITSAVPSPSSVFRICTTSGDGQRLNLNPKEWEILSQIDGQRSVQEVSNSVSCDLFVASKLIYGLVVMKVIERVDDQGAAEDKSNTAGTDPLTLQEKARRLFEKGELENAASEYEKAIQIDPDCFETMRMLGEIYYKLNRLGEASIYVKKARAADPDNEKTMFISGQLHARLGEIPLAVKEWSQLRRITANRKVADIARHNIDIAKKWARVLQRY